MKIFDYKCPSDDSFSLDLKIKEESGLSFPEVYKDADGMIKLATFIKEKTSSKFYYLPFCHTVEGEAMGAIINFEGEIVGPRPKEYVCKTLEDVLSLNDIDFSKGRISETLKAVKFLKEQGHVVVLDICGPLTILNTLVDSKKVFVAMRKNRELLKRVFEKIEKNLLDYFKLAVDYKVDIISYADPVAAVNILGPKLTINYVDDFTFDFLSKVESLLDGDSLVHLCPKTTFQLIGTGRASFEEVDFGEKMPYYEAVKEIKNNTHFLGERCINFIEKIETKKIRKIKLERG